MCPVPDKVDHRIRLRGPWEVRFEGDQDGLSSPTGTSRQRLPASWKALFGNRTGLAYFSRSFNRPSGLTQESHVWLAVASPGGTVSLECNRAELELVPSGQWLQFELTDVLQPHNRIELQLRVNHIPEGHGERLGLWAPVELWLAD